MTEQENGRVRVADEKVLKSMWVEDFYIKMMVFQERMEDRINQIKTQQEKNKLL